MFMTNELRRLIVHDGSYVGFEKCISSSKTHPTSIDWFISSIYTSFVYKLHLNYFKALIIN